MRILELASRRETHTGQAVTPSMAEEESAPSDLDALSRQMSYPLVKAREARAFASPTFASAGFASAAFFVNSFALCRAS